MKKYIVRKWAVRYYNGRPMIALSRLKKCPKFNKDDDYSPFNDPNYYDVYPEDLGGIKLPLKKPVRIKITTEIIKELPLSKRGTNPKEVGWKRENQ